MPPPGPARRQRAGPWLGRSCLHSPRPPSCLHQAGRAARAAHPGPLPAREAPWGSRDTLGIPRLLHAHKDPPVSPAMGMGSWRGGGGGGLPVEGGANSRRVFTLQSLSPPRPQSLRASPASRSDTHGPRGPRWGITSLCRGQRPPNSSPPPPLPPPERGQQSVPTPQEDR